MDYDPDVYTSIYFAPVAELNLSSALRYIFPRAAKGVPGGE